MPCKSFRYVIVLLCATAFLLEVSTRSNINNAIVSMIREDNLATGSHKNNKTIIKSDYCPLPFSDSKSNNNNNGSDESHKNLLPHLPHDTKYDWSPTTQGLILGAFYYGYMIFQVPSGRLSEYFGGKWIVAVGLIASGLINLITPWIAYSIPLLTASRVLLGLFQGVVIPSCFGLNSNWMNPDERSLGFGLINVGGNLGAVFACAVTGIICQNYGWPWSFQGIGIITIVWTILVWLVFVRSRPDPDEVNILIGSSRRGGNDGSMKSASGSEVGSTLDLASMHVCPNHLDSHFGSTPSVPWVKILTNKAVVSAGLSRFCGTFGYLTLQTKLPAYLEGILHQSAAQNGVFNSFLFLATSITMAFGPYLSEILISRQWLSRTNTRKLFSSAAQFGLAFCFLILPLIGCNATYTISLLVIGMFLYGSVMGGDVIVPAEISIHFGTTIYACINMFANFAGVVAPLVTGLMLEDPVDGSDLKHKWDNVFYMVAAVISFGTTVFIFFGSSERQEFDYIDTSDCCGKKSHKVRHDSSSS